MQPLGLPMPSTAPTTLVAGSSPSTMNLGGFMSMGNLSAAMAMDAPAAPPDDGQGKQVIQGLAGEIRGFFTRAKEARLTVEQEMLAALRCRRGEYSAEKLAQIAQDNQPAIYMMVGSSKMRQIEALLRDILIATGTEKPWTTKATPDPEMPPAIVQAAVEQLTMEIQQAMASGFPPTMEQARIRLRQMRDELMPRLVEEAARMAERMETKMEDQLLEGGFLDALDDFITDIATFKTAFLAGPVVRNKPQLTWSPDGQMVVETRLVLEWERVDPFDMYPAPWATSLHRDPLIRKHRLTRTALNELRGVEGFNEEAIKKALDLYDRDGLHEWDTVDSEKARAEGKDHSDLHASGLIDALQYWGSASGQTLLDWGMDASEVEDPTREYQIEAWMVGHLVIKAVLNADPLARRPYYGASFQPVPGSVWGNAPYDLMHDCQDMCNAAARALAANLGISSGPQVAIIGDRLPSGAEVTEMHPWKIWEFTTDPMGSTAQPIQFFQPQSNGAELMTVYERFSSLADEYTGIPRYMTGFNDGAGGAGRTASGISMMIGNASKTVKQVFAGIDTRVIGPALERLHYYNMRYGDDPELKGDVKIIARGAMSLMTKEAAQVRTNEFLAATANPVDMQIIGVEGRAELLRHASKRLDMNADKVVPPLPVLKQRAAEQQQAQQMQMLQQPDPSKENLQDGAPTTDNFSPKRT